MLNSATGFALFLWNNFPGLAWIFLDRKVAKSIMQRLHASIYRFPGLSMVSSISATESS